MGVNVSLADMMGSYNYIVQQALEYLTQYNISHGDLDLENTLIYGDIIVNNAGSIEILNTLKIKWSDGIINEIRNSDHISLSDGEILYTNKIAGDYTKFQKASIADGIPSLPNIISLGLGVYHNGKFYTNYNICDYSGHGSQLNACKLDGIHKDNLLQYIGYQIAYHNTEIILPDMYMIPRNECVYQFSLHKINNTNNLTCDVDDNGLVTCISVDGNTEHYGYLKVWVFSNAKYSF